MGSGTQRTQMLPAMAGCVLPWLVCLLAAVVALNGQVALLRTGATDPAGMTQLATCILLLSWARCGGRSAQCRRWLLLAAVRVRVRSAPGR